MRRGWSLGHAGPLTRLSVPLLVVGLLAIGGCSVEDAGVAAGPTSSSSPGQGSLAAQNAPGEDSGTPSETGESADSPSPSNSESPSAAATSPIGTSDAETGQESEVVVPTPAEQPEPALSQDEIRETYGTGEPEPAESMVGTLCNLNRPHLEELSARVVVEGQLDDQMLRLAALSLSDDLGVWEGMAWQVPEAESEIEVAREIYAHWEYAVGLVDAGDQETAMDEWDAAAELLAVLPPGDVSEVGC